MAKFIKILASLYILVAVMAVLAYRSGYLWMSQPRPPSNKPVAVLIEHGGIWGDVFIISPLVAFIIYKFFETWSWGAISLSFLISTVLTAFMVMQWGKASQNLDEALARNGGPTAPGWIHGVYMWIAVASILMYYFWTDPVAAKPYAAVVSIVLAIHVTIGTLQPEYNTFGWVKGQSLMTVAISWLLILGAYAQLIVRAHKH